MCKEDFDGASTAVFRFCHELAHFTWESEALVTQFALTAETAKTQAEFIL